MSVLSIAEAANISFSAPQTLLHSIDVCTLSVVNWCTEVMKFPVNSGQSTFSSNNTNLWDI